MEILEVSAKTGLGMDAWGQFLQTRRDQFRAAAPHMQEAGHA
jgi:hypothetical protein